MVVIDPLEMMNDLVMKLYSEMSITGKYNCMLFESKTKFKYSKVFLKIEKLKCAILKF